MTLSQRVQNKARFLIQIFGARKTKEALWDHEFARGKWARLDETSGDFVYSFIEEWAHGGSILDLGCGPGNTASELRPETFEKYIGVDISSIAIERATARSAANAQSQKVHFVQSDILTYEPTEEFNVILFRESICYVAMNKIRSLLMRYAKYLKRESVFIVRLWSTSGRYKKIVDLLETHFEMIDMKASPTSPSLVLVFRPQGHRE
ncbi:MAG: class I SAM-dependent methyltransferase [Terracidiphilus sp.]|jgi:SAM-dependent methyltransferase